MVKKSKTKVKPKPPASPLTKAEEFYIDNNANKTDAELATDLGISLPRVREYLHHTQSGGRIAKLMIREKGCTIMTEGASMAADESRKGYVSEQAIKDAVARGDYEEAARLQKIQKEQSHNATEAARERQSTYIHYIDKKR